METLWRVVQSMREAADEAGVDIVTGDTKVVDRGKGDGLFINTAGIGVVEHELRIAPASVAPGDAVLLIGDIGRHGMAIMAVREGLELETTIKSDCAPVAGLVMELVDAGIDIHCMRDLTRGGLAGVVIEIAETAMVSIHLDERQIPVQEEVRGACELLGFDPLYVANEGNFVCFVALEDTDRALEVMHSHPLGSEARLVGAVGDRGVGQVTMKSLIGTKRVVDMISGEQLPRIC
jgi:hydrogenase expression/formation protein HypE